MNRPLKYIFVMALSAILLVGVAAHAREHVVVDAATRSPLLNASVFARNGRMIGLCDKDGRVPSVSSAHYPITIRYMGFSEQTVYADGADTIVMQEKIMELPEMTVDSRARRALHILAYVREYSTLTTYSDTIFMFRDKMVDFMLPTEDKGSYKGWRTPRVLTSNSYFHFTDYLGLDSVSDACNHHYSWSDWIGIAPSIAVPDVIKEKESGTETIRGKFSPTETWTKTPDRLTVDVDVLADTMSRKWVPALSAFFKHNLDFDMFKLRLNYADGGNPSLRPIDLTGYSFTIEATGRGRDVFMFDENNKRYFVRTYAEVYILDKKFIKVSEAKKLERQIFTDKDFAEYMTADIPELSPEIATLIERVDNIDRDSLRIGVAPDQRLVRTIPKGRPESIGTRLKNMFGIGYARGKRKWNRQWNEFLSNQREENRRQK